MGGLAARTSSSPTRSLSSSSPSLSLVFFLLLFRLVNTSVLAFAFLVYFSAEVKMEDSIFTKRC